MKHPHSRCTFLHCRRICDHQSCSSRLRAFHCTLVGLTSAIAPSVSNSDIQFLSLGVYIHTTIITIRQTSYAFSFHLDINTSLRADIVHSPWESVAYWKVNFMFYANQYIQRIFHLLTATNSVYTAYWSLPVS